ncbi:MAG: FGGY family carbohydrate kinase [Pirellulaceae bacterium]|nr:FGGY family carbohydrate kinase [Pirellulaceae bacterium]
MAAGLADLLALDVTTTEFAVAVRDDQGNEDYASVPMRGGTACLNDQAFPAFELHEVPGMLRDLLGMLQSRGWRFDRRDESTPGCLSVACRQHDMVLLDREAQPLLPAISWQCHAATEEVAALQNLGVEKTVGKIEPRFVLPKLACVLNRQPELKERLGTVFMTGDWIAHRLTGQRSLSTSDALSNGLLEQQSRKRADKVMEKAGMDVAWFPEAAQSGTVVGTVQPAGDVAADAWQPLREMLAGWQFVAGLGDNHASAVGCGMTDDYRKLVVSGGTSGTINLSCPKGAKLPEGGDSLQFEFYGDSLLLLLMLADCGAWYNRFLDQFAPELKQTMNELNMLAMSANLTALRRVLHDDGTHREEFPPSWGNCTLGAKVADTQLSIALELLLRVKRMLAEVRAAGVSSVETYVLTGGLSQSLFFQCVFHAGVRLLDPHASVKVSGRTGPLRYKTSAYGALINAELPRVGGKLSELHASGNRFPLGDCVQPQDTSAAALQYLLRSYGI